MISDITAQLGLRSYSRPPNIWPCVAVSGYLDTVLKNAKRFFPPTPLKRPKICQTLTYMPNSIFSSREIISKKAKFPEYGIKMPTWPTWCRRMASSPEKAFCTTRKYVFLPKPFQVIGRCAPGCFLRAVVRKPHAEFNRVRRVLAPLRLVARATGLQRRRALRSESALTQLRTTDKRASLFERLLKWCQ